VLWRVLTVLLWQALAGALFWSLDATQRKVGISLCAALVAANLWFIFDAWRGAQLLRWIREGAGDKLRLGGSWWAEVFDRVRKLERMHARALADSEGRLQDFLAALQASPNGVVLLDAQGRIEWFNQTAGQHFGFDPSRDLLQHFGNLVRDPGFAAYMAAMDFRCDVVMPARDSTSSKPVRLSVQMHPYGAGRSLLLSRDITALEQAEAMRRDFVANVSHEIRTPLTVLAGFVETLQTLPLDANERSRYLALMSQQSQRMQTLVSDLLTLSRLEGSPPPPASTWLLASELTAQCEQDARELSAMIWGKAQDIAFHVDAELEIAGSSNELISAMSNLMGNAVRYSPADRSIEVSWQASATGGAVFSVRDHGQGIAPEHIPRLTERFYRVDRSRSRETGGTGLGLAIVKHVAQRHGAELEIESVPGKGSCFSMVFTAQRVRSRQHARVPFSDA